jgi:outer membrane protein TolC
MPRTLLYLAVLWISLIIAGCGRGDGPKPLTTQAVDAALAPPVMEALRVQAAAIHHPMLQPLEIQPDEPLSPDEAAVLAVLANPSLRAVRDERKLADAQLLQAGVLPNPVLTIGNDFPYTGPDHRTAYSFGLAWEATALVARPAKLAEARTHRESVDLDIAWQEWQVAQSAKGAAWKVLSLKEQESAAMQANDDLLTNLQRIRKAVDLRQKTAVDLAAAAAAQQESWTAVLETQRDLHKQELALKKLLGLPAQAQINLRPGDLPESAALPPAQELQTGIEDRRLDLLALRRGYDSQEAAVRAAVLGRFPKITPGGATARDTAGAYTYGYSLGIDLPIFDRNQGAIATEKATRQKLFDEFTTRVFEGRSEIAVSLEEIRSLGVQIASGESALAVQKDLVAQYQRAVDTGNADVLSYYLARNDLNKRRIEILKLKQERIDAWIELENASGMYLGRTAAATTRPPTPTSSAPAGEGVAP